MFLRTLLSVVFLGLTLTLPMGNGDALAQVNQENSESNLLVVQFNKLSLQKLQNSSNSNDFSNPEDLELQPLSVVEKNIAQNLDSHWVWPEYTLEMIDSYSPFLFRTKKSQLVDELKVVLEVDSRGKIAGFEVLGEVDKGLKERLDYMVRKMPTCKPVPGFSSYTPETFELTIRK